MKQKVLIISLSNLSSDPRVLVQYEALKDLFEIHTMGYKPLHPEIKHYNIGIRKSGILSKLKKAFFLFLRSYKYYLRIEQNTIICPDWKEEKYDAVICNDLNVFPLVHQYGLSKSNIWIDLHEFSPRQYENYRWWRILFAPYVHWQAKVFLPRCKCISTVCKNIALEYEKQYGITVDEIIYNKPHYADLFPQKNDGNIIQLVHHGGAQRHRHLEFMLEVVKQLGEGYKLHLYLMANNDKMRSYQKELERRVKDQDLNVEFHEPVSTYMIPETLNPYDIGIFLLKPVNFNYLNALPNKLFEFVQARLAVVVSPNPEMKRMVEEHNIGLVCKEYSAESMVEAIKKITDHSLWEYKQNAHENALALSSKDSIEKIRTLIHKTIHS